MLCRLLVTTIAISYLICVLLLSGLQKEDLDVNMLKKLQRHNVNIDDMNNENLRAECLSKSNSDTSLSTERSAYYKQNESTTLRVSMKQESEGNVGDAEETRRTDVQTVISYFNNALIEEESPKKYNDDFVAKQTQNPNTTYGQTSYVKNNFNTYTNTQSTKSNHYKNDITEFDKGQPKIESIMKFWNMYATNNEIPTQPPEAITQRVINTENELSAKTKVKSSIKDIDRSRDLEYINKILADYVSNSKTISTTTQRINSIPIYIDTVSRHIKQSIGRIPNTDQILPYNNIDTRYKANKIIENANSNNNNDEFYIPQEKKYSNLNYVAQGPTINKPKHNVEEEKNMRKNNTIHYVEEILRLNDKLKLFGSSVTALQNTPDSIQEVDTQPTEVLYDTKTEDDFYIKRNEDNRNKKQMNILTEDLIIQIAQSVKAIVLKDLQKVITTSTTAKTTSVATTTEILTSTTRNHDKVKTKDANFVIEKFMEIYQQFKSIKESTIVNADTKYKMVERNVQHDNKSPFDIMYPIVPSANAYAIRNQPANVLPILINPYQDTCINTPIVPNVPIKPNSFNKITQLNIYNHKNEYSSPPITLQTNSDEIPPLGIPISQPMKLINQNIVVSTKRPYFEVRNEQYLTYRNRDNGNYNNNKNKNRRDRLETYFNLPPHLRENDNVRSHFIQNGDRKFQTKHQENSKYSNGFNDHQIQDTQMYDHSDYERMRPYSYEVKKFHEKLERTDNWPPSVQNEREFEDKEDCCKLKVASRQQLPLSDVKKRSRYDDTHFRNFLKTQEKVNNMLERILATKTKSDGPRSVETT